MTKKTKKNEQISFNNQCDNDLVELLQKNRTADENLSRKVIGRGTLYLNSKVLSRTAEFQKYTSRAKTIVSKYKEKRLQTA